MFSSPYQIILASASSRRQTLLKDAGVPFITVPASDDAEPKPETGECPVAFSMRAALAKASAIARNIAANVTVPGLTPAAADTHQKYLVLGADTLVTLNGTIFGKPADASEALSFLSALAGKTHEVITGCALVPVTVGPQSTHQAAPIPGALCAGSTHTFFVSTQVHFWQCPTPLLKQYSQSDEVKDKAGAYAIQGEGAFLASSITGSWTNVVGLPVAELITVLIEKNFLTPTA